MRILFVEDSQLVTRVISYLFEQANQAFEVVHCATYASAFEAIETSEPFDFCLVDLNLPDATNGEVAELTLEHAIPTIVLSGSYDESRREALLKQGVVDYIIKESRYSYEYAVNLIGRLRLNRQVKVLLAEDSVSYRALIKKQLEAYQYQVIGVTNGVEAMAQLREDDTIRLLITDYEMPKMNGIELVRAVRKEFEDRELRIIGLSASEQDLLSVKFIKNGANDFLRKPFNYEELHCRVLQNVEQAELVEQVKDAAYRDFLTRLHNRRFLMEKLGDTLNNDSSEYCLAIMDLDHFKQINDQWGHDGGDHVLKGVGELLSSHLGRFSPTRIGGEEFCVLLKGLQIDQSRKLMETFCEMVNSREFLFEGEVIPVSISTGLTFRYPEEKLGDVMRRADEALYFAKEQGRNRVVVF